MPATHHSSRPTQAGSRPADRPADRPTTRADDPDITALALAAGAGCLRSAESFVRATRADVWRFLAYLSDPQAADDLTQETYLRVWTALPRFTGASSARTWLLSIARRVAVDRLRAAAARPRTVDAGDWPRLVELAQDTGLPGFDEGILLADLCRRLDPDRRAAFLLTQVLGLGYAEAAAALACPVGTVRSRVSRARADLLGTLRGDDHPATTAKPTRVTPTRVTPNPVTQTPVTPTPVTPAARQPTPITRPPAIPHAA
ncbi:sigma-70 family RNA polymerase sigma factor [Uniformispora flossi]|uniref:sigma-70 family RNA polymerase sigma factor n=1 Tax=Uniformispora flossi TaxID=3390723 RepID=UPI003C2BC9AF